MSKFIFLGALCAVEVGSIGFLAIGARESGIDSTADTKTAGPGDDSLRRRVKEEGNPEVSSKNPRFGRMKSGAIMVTSLLGTALTLCTDTAMWNRGVTVTADSPHVAQTFENVGYALHEEKVAEAQLMQEFSHMYDNNDEKSANTNEEKSAKPPSTAGPQDNNPGFKSFLGRTTRLPIATRSEKTTTTTQSEKTTTTTPETTQTTATRRRTENPWDKWNRLYDMFKARWEVEWKHYQEASGRFRDAEPNYRAGLRRFHKQYSVGDVAELDRILDELDGKGMELYMFFDYPDGDLRLGLEMGNVRLKKDVVIVDPEIEKLLLDHRNYEVVRDPRDWNAKNPDLSKWAPVSKERQRSYVKKLTQYMSYGVAPFSGHFMDSGVNKEEQAELYRKFGVQDEQGYKEKLLQIIDARKEKIVRHGP